MIRLVVLAFILAVLVLGAMSALGQSNDACNVPVELMPEHCWPVSSSTVGPQLTPLPTATAWSTARPTADLRPYPAPYPDPEEQRGYPQIFTDLHRWKCNGNYDQVGEKTSAEAILSRISRCFRPVLHEKLTR
jgi:hypothetical protein